MKPNLALSLCAVAFTIAMVGAPPAARADDRPWWMTHRPMQPYLNGDGTFRRLKGSITTSSWSGYAVTASAPYTSASATWQVPDVDYDGGATPYGYEYVFNWVGIGGFGDATLIQIGTELMVSTSGATYFYAWYELYPASDVEIPLSVKAGDTITASLTCIAACSPSQIQTWQLAMKNVTAHTVWTQSFQYQSSMASADWVTEPPYYNGILPLADYGQVTFNPVAANGANPNLSLSANGIIAQVPWGQTSNPSSPVNGNEFSTCWGAKGAALTPCVVGSVAVPPPTSPPPPSLPPPPPANNVSATLTANPTTVTPGQASKLTWTSTNATTCAGNGFTVGNRGKYVTGPFAWASVFPRVTTSYAITCTGAGDPATAMVTVTVKK